MELFSENQLFAKTFLFWYHNGKNPLLLEDMLSEINIEVPISWPKKLENLKLFSPQKMEDQKLDMKFLISQKVESEWLCII